MLMKLLDTHAGVPLLLVRFPLGLDMFVHGYQKVTHIPSTMRYFDGLGVPHSFAWLAIIAEFCGGLGLMIGVLSRIAAFGVACTMTVAIFLRHLPYGYLMNWHGALPFGTEGYEYHTLAIGMALAVMLAGAGALSLDRLCALRLSSSQAAASFRPAPAIRDRSGGFLPGTGIAGSVFVPRVARSIIVPWVGNV